MMSDVPPASPEPGRNLPPVQPPSGRFIAQLFLVPGLIVLVVVLLVLAINYLFVGGQTPDQFLIRLDNPNPDIRWRGANDLAQVLKRKESVHLRTDVGFALDLCDRLNTALVALEAEEKTLGATMGPGKESDTNKVFRKLEAQRSFVMFLAASLGDFSFPAGAPLLCDMIGQKEGPDILASTMRRRQAIWALANLGENVKSFKGKLKPEQQALILAKLRKELESPETTRTRAAKNALALLGEPGPKDDLVAVDAVLAKAAEADDQFLREQVAVTFNFWDGPLAEPTLLKLSRDDGFGTLLRTPGEP